jgi:hypothetical protein
MSKVLVTKKSVEVVVLAENLFFSTLKFSLACSTAFAFTIFV